MGGGITLSNNNGLSGPYTIVANGSITFNNNSVVGAPQMPLVIATNGGLNFGNNVNVWGYFYAPTANATINNNATVNGAIAALNVSVGNNGAVTYVTNGRGGLPH